MPIARPRIPQIPRNANQPGRLMNPSFPGEVLTNAHAYKIVRLAQP
jgi:hypothetical protein